MRRSRLVWADIFSRWLDHKVPLIEVLPMDSRWSPYEECWALRDGPGLFPYRIENPMADTARRLVRGFEGEQSESYAIFLLLAFMIQQRSFISLEVGDVVFPMEKQIDGVHLWHRNAKYVMPDMGRSYERRLDVERTIAAAAKEWREIADRYAVVRVPNFILSDREV